MVDSCMQYRPRYQFEPSSGTLENSAIYNCGPTGAAQQADYYLGRLSGTTQIEPLRAIAGVARGIPTNAWEQAAMLTNLGIPTHVREITSIEQLARIVGRSGHRPTGIGLDTTLLRAQTRGHSYLGWHRITLLRYAVRTINGIRRRGFYYTDPNFSSSRPDPHKGHRWINARELKRAFIDNDPSWAIVPDGVKKDA